MKKNEVLTCALSSCGLPFIRSNKDRKNRKYCSHNCYAIAKRINANVAYPRLRVNGKMIYLHRFIYEQLTGEVLTANDVIHHIDGNPYNRDISNLEKLEGQAAHLHKHNYHRKNEWTPDNEIPF